MQKLTFAVLIVMLTISCTKLNSGYSNNGGPSLWPLKAGNSWIYKDSVFSDTALTSTYLDTATLTTQTLVDSYGNVYFGIQEPNGWFGTGGYVAVDPYNTTIYELDSLSNSPYIFFQTVQQDGAFIGSGSDYSNPSCPIQSAQYGYATAVSINGYNCLENVEYITNCNNVTTEAIATYVSPGIGVVRMEDYMADSTRNDSLYKDYSQTLQSQKLN